MPRPPDMKAHFTLWKNLGEVDRLLEIHSVTSGTGVGFKKNVEVLNKSAIVLLVACWEAFIEYVAESAFKILLRRARTHITFSRQVLSLAGKSLKESNNPLDLWKLAGAGWRDVLRMHKKALFNQYIGKLNTPRPAQVDGLYKCLLGINSISSQWHWHGMTFQKAKKKLDRLVTLRGSIAHRVTASQRIHKDHVREQIEFVNRIAVETSNAVREFVLQSTGKEPWSTFTYGDLPESHAKD